jgi:hypothetical protein
MLTDANKMLHILIYNYLNLPDSIDFENDLKIKYLYASGGAKLRQVTYNNGTPTEQLDYSGSFASTPVQHECLRKQFFEIYY